MNTVKSLWALVQGRPGLHEAGQRLAHDLVDLDDPGVYVDPLDLERHLRRCTIALGARLGGLHGSQLGSRSS